jgi:hypothetical protein
LFGRDSSLRCTFCAMQRNTVPYRRATHGGMCLYRYACMSRTATAAADPYRRALVRCSSLLRAFSASVTPTER